MKQNLVFLTGAGMSAESGISTFRDSDGLWENYDVMEVASIEGWQSNPKLMLDFYNQRRRQLEKTEPNEGHRIIASLEASFTVRVVTQNVDNLHERAGSTSVIHLHGELTKACSSYNKNLIYDIGYRDISWGEKAEDGAQLRPFIVWFGEAVPMIEAAAGIVSEADILVIVGSSLQVYPAAGLVDYARRDIPIYLIDPKEVQTYRDITVIREKAVSGLRSLKEVLLQ